MASVRTFLDALTNWYVRRSRERFWAGDPEALDVLWTVLTTLCQVAAPLLPLTTEAVYRGLVGDDASVHLTDWPTSDRPGREPCLGGGDGPCSRRVQRVVGGAQGNGSSGAAAVGELDDLGSAMRNRSRRSESIIADEINVKDVVLSTDLDAVGEFELTVVPSVLGPRVGKDVQKVIGRSPSARPCRRAGPARAGTTVSSNAPTASRSVDSTTCLTLTSSAMMSRNGASDRRRRDGDRQARQRLAHPTPVGLAHRRRRAAHVADEVHRRDQGRALGQVGTRRPVGEVHAALAGETAVDVLGRQRQQRRGDLAQRVSTVCNVSIASWSPAQNRSRMRRMYQLVSASRNVRTEPHAANRS